MLALARRGKRAVDTRRRAEMVLHTGWLDRYGAVEFRRAAGNQGGLSATAVAGPMTGAAMTTALAVVMKTKTVAGIRIGTSPTAGRLLDVSSVQTGAATEHKADGTKEKKLIKFHGY